MNATARLLSAVTITLFLFCLPHRANAIDISETFYLERYTILADQTIKLEQGNLLRNGQFRVLLSEIVDPIFIGTLADFEPISGRPIMSAQMYEAYKAVGAIPRWVRSRHEFSIGFVSYVIVSISGGRDPNPTPVIHFQPLSQRVLIGDNTLFAVGASPFDYLSYQWKFRGKPLPNANLPVLWVNNVTKTNAGVYTVAVSAGGRPVVSKRALLRVVTPVTIKSQPVSRSVRVGAKVVFRVAAQGTGPFAYQWYHNGEAIPNATRSFLAVPRASSINEGNYQVVVDNELSVAESVFAVLTVVP